MDTLMEKEMKYVFRVLQLCKLRMIKSKFTVHLQVRYETEAITKPVDELNSLVKKTSNLLSRY